MDLSLLIRQRLQELDLDQKDLAAAAAVTESYISQLLARKKVPPAPGRTDLYEKAGDFLRVPKAELETLAESQRKLELKKKAAEAPVPLYPEWRAALLRKCAAERRDEVQRIFERDAFGEIERLVRQKVLEVLAAVPDVGENAAVLEGGIDGWDIDLRTFALEISSAAGSGKARHFAFVERPAEPARRKARGWEQFLSNQKLSGDATREEIEFLRSLRIPGARRPTALYYYRELQNLRDPLHFTGGS